MNKDTFTSYKFKPSDVIEGLNRYFADAKANRYRRVPLEIRNGVWTSNPDYRKDIAFTNSYSDASVTTKASERGWKYYLICDPEEVVGVAINWLREEHDIFYTPGMAVPVEDFDVDEAAREYEKATRTSEPMMPVAKVREVLGINREVDFFEALRCARGDMDAATRLRLESSELRHQNHQFGKRLADIRHAAGMADGDQTDLVEYVETLRECEEEYEHLYKQYERMYCELRDAKFTNLSEERDRYKWLYENLKNGILKLYREIFDCSNGDPEGTDEETMQDILTEYQRVLMLKDAAEEKAIKYKELARENEEKANKEKDQWKRKAEDTNAGWEADRWLTDRLLNEQRDFITKVAKILEVKNPYIESEYAAAISKLRTTVAHPNRYKWLYENLKNGMASVLQEAEERED